MGGARIEVSDDVPVSSSVHISFVDDLNLEAYGIVRNSSGEGSIGVEFTRLMFCGSLVRQKPRPPLVKFATALLVVSGVVLSVLLYQRIPRNWKLFESKVDPGGVTRAVPSFSFTLGSSMADVRKVQGSPTSATDTVWSYGASAVHFRLGRVSGWSSSPSEPLRVGAAGVQSPEAKRGYFTLGSTAAEVLVVQGPPAELTDSVWKYGSSEVHFRDGRVVGWKSSPEHPLKSKTS